MAMQLELSRTWFKLYCKDDYLPISEGVGHYLIIMKWCWTSSDHYRMVLDIIWSLWDGVGHLSGHYRMVLDGHYLIIIGGCWTLSDYYGMVLDIIWLLLDGVGHFLIIIGWCWTLSDHFIGWCWRLSDHYQVVAPSMLQRVVDRAVQVNCGRSKNDLWFLKLWIVKFWIVKLWNFEL